jgi:type II secretory pathway component PulC
MKKQSEEAKSELELSVDPLQEMAEFDRQLQTSLFRWRLVSGLLLLLLILSWLWFLAKPDDGSRFASQRSISSEITHQDKDELKAVTASPQAALNATQQLTNKNARMEGDKQPYHPQIRQERLIASNEQTAIGRTPSEKPDRANEHIVLLEELPEIVRDEFPELSINSYVLADDPQKSFVVINNQIYGQNEILAPHTKLLSIEQDAIIVLFKDYRVKLPLN